MGSSAESSNGNGDAPATEELKACPVCGSGGEGQKFLFWTFDRLYRLPGKFGEVECGNCGLVYVSPRPVKQGLGFYYPDEYAPHQTAAFTLGGQNGGGLVSTLRNGIRATVLKDLGYGDGNLKLWQRASGPVTKRLFHSPATYGWGDRFPRNRPGGRALDIGCGNGVFLSYLKHHGWQVNGVDMSPAAAAAAREHFGIDVFVGDMEDAPFPDGHFDYVNMSHVLEHVPDPIATMDNVRRLLKDDGTVYVEVPNYASFGCESGGEYWFALDAPRHLYSFSPGPLRKLLETCGFRVERMKSRVADLFVWDETLRKEEAAGELLPERPAAAAVNPARLAYLKGRARVGKMLRPLSGDYLCCWAVKSEAHTN